MRKYCKRALCLPEVKVCAVTVDFGGVNRHPGDARLQKISLGNSLSRRLFVNLAPRIKVSIFCVYYRTLLPACRTVKVNQLYWLLCVFHKFHEWLVGFWLQTGDNVPPGRLPYFVSLRTIGTFSHFCGGILVYPQIVITAAHCVDSLSSSNSGVSEPIAVIGSQGINDDEADGAEVEMNGVVIMLLSVAPQDP